MEWHDIEIQAFVRYNIARGLNDAECTDEMRLIFGANRISPEEVRQLYDRFGGYASPRLKPIIKAENSTDIDPRAFKKRRLSDSETDVYSTRLEPENYLSNIIKEEPIDIVDELISTEDAGFYKDFDRFGKNEDKRNDLVLNKECLDDNFKRGEHQLKICVDQGNDHLPKTFVLKKSLGEKLEKRHPCKYCHKSYKFKSHLNRHVYYMCEIARSLNEGRLKPLFHCEKCNIEFTSKFALERHEFFIHVESNVKLTCRSCLKSFANKNSLKTHLKSKRCQAVDHENRFPCNDCTRTYRDKTSLMRHMQRECRKEPEFGCAHCDFKTLQKSNIVRHLLRTHSSGLARVMCPNCPRSYKNECTLKRHLDFECGKEPSFACEFCEYKTKRKHCLRTHVQICHRSD